MTTELHNRRQQAQDDLGLNNSKEQERINNALEKEQLRKQAKEKRRYEIEQSGSYMAVKKISKVMDDWYLDSILGFILPVGLGDTIPSLLVIPYIYISLAKVHSVPLTLAVIFNILKDMLLGMIPFFIGDIIDVFNKGYKQNMKLIIGFVEDDREVIKKVNEKAFAMALGIVIVCVLIYFCIKMLIGLGNWIFGLF